MKPIINRKASYNYNLLEKFEAGVVLSGNEIKSVRAGKASLEDAYALVRGGEAILINAHIALYEKGSATDQDNRKDRKLLLHKKEIDYLLGKLAGSNLTVVPTRLYFKRNYAKIELALAAGKKKHDKRAALIKKEQEREAEKVLRKEKLTAQQKLKTSS